MLNNGLIFCFENAWVDIIISGGPYREGDDFSSLVGKFRSINILPMKEDRSGYFLYVRYNPGIQFLKEDQDDQRIDIEESKPTPFS